MKKAKKARVTPWRGVNWRRWVALVAVMTASSLVILFPFDEWMPAMVQASPSIDHLPQKVRLRSFSKAEAREATRARIGIMKDLQAARSAADPYHAVAQAYRGLVFQGQKRQGVGFDRDEGVG